MKHHLLPTSRLIFLSKGNMISLEVIDFEINTAIDYRWYNAVHEASGKDPIITSKTNFSVTCKEGLHVVTFITPQLIKAECQILIDTIAGNYSYQFTRSGNIDCQFTEPEKSDDLLEKAGPVQ